MLWQNNNEDEPHKVLGAVDAHTGKALWSRTITSPADGVLAASRHAALLYTEPEVNCTFAAVTPERAQPLWSFDASDAGQCTIQAAYGMAHAADEGALLFMYKRTGQNLLVDLSPAGAVLQQVDFGQIFGVSTLAPTGANVLVTADGGAIVALGSPNRLVRLAGSGGPSTPHELARQRT